jgi:hypothetical protein
MSRVGKRSKRSPLSQRSLKGAFIGFLPVTRAFAKTTVRRWGASTGLRIGLGELRAPSGPGADGVGPA